MSRIGKQKIDIPQNTSVVVKDNLVIAKGPLGELSRAFSSNVQVNQLDGCLVVSRVDDSKLSKAMHGLYRQLIANIVIGVSYGFEKRLIVNGIGFRVDISGDIVTLALGYSTLMSYRIPDGITVEYDKKDTISIKGIDKQVVGQVAAEIRSLRKPEPYKGKGIRYADETIKLKAGKSGVK